MKTLRLFSVIFLALLFAPTSFGQGAFAPPQTALKNINGIAMPIARASITVCGPGAMGIPCAPVLNNTIFSDLALTKPLPNPFTSDAYGNYQFAASPSTYTVTVTAPGYQGYSYQVSLGTGSGSGGAPNGAIVFTNVTAVNLPTSYASPNLLWSCWDNSTPYAKAIYPSKTWLNLSNYTLTWFFAFPQSGFCVANGSGGTGTASLPTNIGAQSLSLTTASTPALYNLYSASPATGGYQGWATDGTYNYLIGTGVIYKVNQDATWSFVTSNPAPFSGLTAGINHLGDGEYSGGNLYVAAENYTSCSSYSAGTLAVYGTGTGLPLSTSRNISADGHETSAVAVDAAANSLYVTSFCNGVGDASATIWIYNLSTLTLTGTLTMSQNVPYIQGITYNAASNTLFISADNSTETQGFIYEVSPVTGQTTLVYSLPTSEFTGELEGLDYTQNTLGFMENTIVYFLAPAIYQNITGNEWTESTFQRPGITTLGRIAKDGNGLDFTDNAWFDPSTWGGWRYDDPTLPAFMFLEEESTNSMQMRVCPSGLTQPFGSAAGSSCQVFTFNASGLGIGSGATVPTVNSPTVGQAACIKSAGPPVVLGYCSSVVSSGGACTCN
jgi:hypothetical protein